MLIDPKLKIIIVSSWNDKSDFFKWKKYSRKGVSLTLPWCLKNTEITLKWIIVETWIQSDGLYI